MTSQNLSQKSPIWFLLVTGLGLAWNIFGAVQFMGTLNATPESLQAQGLTPEQALVMLGYPTWMTVAFALGVFGGIVGCILLLLKKRQAFAVFLASLLGYIVLYVGDIVEGVFAALGTPQVIVLSVVVLIAALLLWLSHLARNKNYVQ